MFGTDSAANIGCIFTEETRMMARLLLEENDVPRQCAIAIDFVSN